MSTNPTQLDLEFAYTPWAASCQDPLAQDFRECRRPKGHTGKHASGIGNNLKEWTQK